MNKPIRSFTFTFTRIPYIFERSENPAPSLLGLWLILILISSVGVRADDDDLADVVAAVVKPRGTTIIAGNAAIADDDVIIKAGNAYITKDDVIIKAGNAYISSRGTVIRAGNAFVGDRDVTIKAGNAYIDKNGASIKAGSALIGSDK